MKPRIILYATVALCMGAFAVLSPNRLSAEDDPNSPPAALVKELQDQQATLADNQKQIDTKLADIAEALRTARIFAGRSK